MTSVERYERDQKFRKRLDVGTRKQGPLDHLKTGVILLAIFALLRVVMLSRGMAFFYIPLFDDGVSQIISWSHNFFENSKIWK